MPRKRSLNADVRGIEVPHFSDHDDIGVLAQDRAQGVGEGEPRLFVDLHLAYAWQVVFYRVFDGDDVHLRPRERLQDRVKARAFAGAGRPREEYHAVGTADEVSSLSRS